jgi:hypothetical protein
MFLENEAISYIFYFPICRKCLEIFNVQSNLVITRFKGPKNFRAISRLAQFRGPAYVDFR